MLTDGAKMPGYKYDKGKQAIPNFGVALKTKPKHKSKDGNWIQGAIKKPGALHRQLGVKIGKKIPQGKLAKVAKTAKKGSKLGKRLALAKTLKGFKKHKKIISTPKSKMVKEHQNLVKVLKGGKKGAIKKEAKKQGKELAEYKKMKKRGK